MLAVPVPSRSRVSSTVVSRVRRSRLTRRPDPASDRRPAERVRRRHLGAPASSASISRAAAISWSSSSVERTVSRRWSASEWLAGNVRGTRPRRRQSVGDRGASFGAGKPHEQEVRDTRSGPPAGPLERQRQGGRVRHRRARWTRRGSTGRRGPRSQRSPTPSTPSPAAGTAPSPGPCPGCRSRTRPGARPGRRPC